MIDLKFELNGGKELSDALQELPRRVSNKILRKALRQGGNVLLKKARANAPVKSGVLRRSIKLRVDLRGTPAAIITVRIPPKSGIQKAKLGPYYGSFLELGTRKMAAHPFLRPAFDSVNGDALEKFIETLNDGIEAEAKTL